jgi:hypothetical protein
VDLPAPLNDSLAALRLFVLPKLFANSIEIRSSSMSLTLGFLGGRPPAFLLLFATLVLATMQFSNR